MKDHLIFIGMCISLLLIGWLSHDVMAEKEVINRPSPQNRITSDSIHVFDSQVILDVQGVQWAEIAPTRSMDPVVDAESHALQIEPLLPSEIVVGDIISFRLEDYSVIHRVVELGVDENGWFAVTRGDNVYQNDAEKVRFQQVEGVVIGILY